MAVVVAQTRSTRTRAPTSPGITAGAKRRRRDDVWIGVTALVAACLALPFAQSSWHGAEASAILAVSATVMLAGQRWAIAPVVLAELLLLPTLWPRAFAGHLDATAVAGLVTLAAIVPGVLAMRRAAAAVVLVSGRRRTRGLMRATHVAFYGVGIVAALLPLLAR